MGRLARLASRAETSLSHASAVKAKRRLCLYAQVLSACFTSGAVGGLCYQLAALMVAALDIPQLDALNVEGSMEELYRHVTLGGVCGSLFMLKPGRVASLCAQAVIYGMAPAAARLLHMYHRTHLHMEAITPAYVLLLNIMAWAAPGLAFFRLLGSSYELEDDVMTAGDHHHHGAVRMGQPGAAGSSGDSSSMEDGVPVLQGIGSISARTRSQLLLGKHAAAMQQTMNINPLMV